jgi:hypothetical protein
MDEYGDYQSDRHLHSVGPDFLSDMEMDDLPVDWGACERLEREARRSDSLLTPLIALVGDVDALYALDAEPIPDEPFDWSAVAAPDRDFVAQVLELTDRGCDALLDVEFRSITRRLIARVAQRDPRPLRRSRDAARCAAAFVWLAGRANGEFGRRGMRPAFRVWDFFGASSAADRGRTLRRAAGLETGWVDGGSAWDDELCIGDVSFLHSRFRARLIARRDLYLEIERDRRNWNPRADGRVEVRARPVDVVTATRAPVSDGSASVLLIGLGDDVDHADFFVLTIAEAKSLVARVQGALDTPPPYGRA